MTMRGMSPEELQMLRHDLRKQKQKIIAENLPMTESEAVKFWAVYQKYADELRQINDEKFALLHGYSRSFGSMSNDDALIFMRRWLEVDEKVVQLRSKYLPLVRVALPGSLHRSCLCCMVRLRAHTTVPCRNKLAPSKGAIHLNSSLMRPPWASR